MISFVEGVLESTDLMVAVVAVGGLGYSIRIPLSTAATLPAPGSTVRLHTSFVVREDSQELYGFAKRDDRDTFERITKRVSGVGPRLALSILSHFSTADLQRLVSTSDAAGLARCPGIGTKTAERIIVDLRGVLPDTAAAGPGVRLPHPVNPTAAGSGVRNDAVLALIALGYKPADAESRIAKASEKAGPDATADVLIRAALR